VRPPPIRPHKPSMNRPDRTMIRPAACAGILNAGVAMHKYAGVFGGRAGPVIGAWSRAGAACLDESHGAVADC
jgi:hypothetical protein